MIAKLNLRGDVSPYVHRFNKLPHFVKVILTARKQLGETDSADFFKAWSPKFIEPENDKNMDDMERLLTLKLEAVEDLVVKGETANAVKILTRKSKVGDPSQSVVQNVHLLSIDDLHVRSWLAPGCVSPCSNQRVVSPTLSHPFAG